MLRLPPSQFQVRADGIGKQSSACQSALRSTSARRLSTKAAGNTLAASEESIAEALNQTVSPVILQPPLVVVTEEPSTTRTAWWEVDCPPNMVNVCRLSDLVTRVEEVSTGGTLVVVNFFAEECYACKSMQPKLRQIARDNVDVLFIKVNGALSDFQTYCEDMGINRIPYFHFYQNNKRVAAFAANMRPEKLALLRKEIAAHKSAAVPSCS